MTPATKISAVPAVPPHVDVSLAPSRLFGGESRSFVPNVVLPAPTPGFATAVDPATGRPIWTPIDGTIDDPSRGPWYCGHNVIRAVYVTRQVIPIRLLVLAWDVPPVVIVRSAWNAEGKPLPKGWHESRLVTAEMMEGVRVAAAAVGAGAGGGEVDEWKTAMAMAKANDLERALAESQEHHFVGHFDGHFGGGK